MGTLPQMVVEVGFASSGSSIVWTDVSAYVRSGSVSRLGTRLAGPLWNYQPGTASIVLKNPDGRFDPDNLAGPYTQNTQTIVQTFTSSGSWTAPATLSGGTVKVEAWGGGGGGTSVGASAGGGEYAAEPALAVTPGKSYTVTVGAAGIGGAGPGGNSGTNGGNTVFAGDAVTVTAHGGTAGTTGSGHGPGGTGSTNTTHHDGGAGNTTSGNGGAGGGGSAGPAAAGNQGSLSPAGNAAGPGATPVPGGGPGGDGAVGGASATNASPPPFGPGGGGGGGGFTGTANTSAGNGYAGQVVLTYTVTLTTAQTQVRGMVPVRVSAIWNSTTYRLFTGYADSWTDLGQNLPTYTEVTLAATDGFKVLAGITLPATSAAGSGENSGARISRILDQASWPAGQRSIDVGNGTLQATTFGDTALNLMQLTADSEAGDLYINGAGNLTFRRRQAALLDSRSTTPQGVFGDRAGTTHSAGTELAYTRPGRANDDTTLFNDIQITRVGGTLQEAEDGTSEAKYLFPRSYARSDLLMQDDTTALAYAQWVLVVADSAENRFDSLDIHPQRDTANLYPQVLGREIGDRIQVWRRPPGVASPVTRDSFIRGISHAWDPSAGSFTTSWTLQDASKYTGFLVLDSTTNGQLDVDALGY